jgi:hypothetical protein
MTTIRRNVQKPFVRYTGEGGAKFMPAKYRPMNTKLVIGVRDADAIAPVYSTVHDASGLLP